MIWFFECVKTKFESEFRCNKIKIQTFIKIQTHNMFVTLFFIFSQFRFETTNYFFHFFHRSTIRKISLIKTWIIEQIIAKIEMIETNATNMIWNRKSKKRRKRKRKRKSCEWKSWLQKWKSWLQRNVENVWLFVWWNDRFLRQNKANRFRRRRLLKTFRFWTFQILINRCLLIECRQKVDDDAKLIWNRWSSVETLRRNRTFSMRM